MGDHPYECQNKGHEGGSRTFTHAPPEWFIQRGLSAPRNCPECKAWIQAQVDSSYPCKECNQPIQEPAKKKISFFKGTGPYVPPTVCKHCESAQLNHTTEYVPPFTSYEDETKPEETGNTLGDRLIDMGFSNPTKLNLIADPAAYIGIPHASGSTQTRQEHIEVHAGYTAEVKNKTKAACGMPAGTFQALLNDAADLAWLSSIELALQKTEKRNGYVCKVDLETGDKIVLREEDDGVYSLVTVVNILKD